MIVVVFIVAGAIMGASSRLTGGGGFATGAVTSR